MESLPPPMQNITVNPDHLPSLWSGSLFKHFCSHDHSSDYVVHRPIVDSVACLDEATQENKTTNHPPTLHTTYHPAIPPGARISPVCLCVCTF